MSTQEQTNANRQNAQSSTGPKTAEGKATSSQNAVKHGFFAKNDVISGEDLARYEQHRQDIYDEFAPLTPTESVLTQRIASLTWRLMRADRLQTTVINTLVAAQHKAAPQTITRKFNIDKMIKTLREKDENPEVEISDGTIIIAGLAYLENETFNSDPAVDKALNAAMNPPGSPHICQAEILLGTVIYNDFNGPAVIERLQSYEQRIESSLFKTIRQFQQMQETSIKQGIARNKMEWGQLCIENEERKNRLDDEYRQNMREKERTPQACRHKFNPPVPPGGSSHSPSAQNEPNSPLTSITETTYNESHDNKEKTSNPPERPSPPPHQYPDQFCQIAEQTGLLKGHRIVKKPGPNAESAELFNWNDYKSPYGAGMYNTFSRRKAPSLSSRAKPRDLLRQPSPKAIPICFGFGHFDFGFV
jgi:hypothetical protein